MLSPVVGASSHWQADLYSVLGFPHSRSSILPPPSRLTHLLRLSPDRSRSPLFGRSPWPKTKGETVQASFELQLMPWQVEAPPFTRAIQAMPPTTHY